MVKDHSDSEIGPRCRHMGYSFRLATRALLYASSHRQDNTHQGLCYTSCGALAGMRNSSMGLLLWHTFRSAHLLRLFRMVRKLRCVCVKRVCFIIKMSVELMTVFGWGFFLQDMLTSLNNPYSLYINETTTMKPTTTKMCWAAKNGRNIILLTNVWMI